MDKIRIEGLRLKCIIGVNEHERQVLQEVVLELCLDSDLSRAGQSDDLKDTVDYKTLKLAIRDFVEASQFFLIERLAQGVADICLQDARIQKALVRVDKPGALSGARSVAVEIERERPCQPRP